MLTSRTTFLSLSTAALLVTAACAANQRAVTETNANETVVSSTPPFQTEEPERYRATRTVTSTNAAGETVVTKYVIARDGELRRDESETLGRRYVVLVSAEGKFLLLPADKLFAAVPDQETDTGEEEADNSPDRLLHTELLTSSYESLGAETVNGRETQKYRVVANSSQAESVNNGETFLWFDETLHMPVKSESKSPDGTRVTTELVDVVLKVDRSLFEVPKDCQEIEFKKAWDRLRPNQP